jgi:hypothetical protein
MLFESCFGRSASKTFALSALLATAGCSGASQRDAHSASSPPASGSAIEIPRTPPRRPLARVRVASDLANPRGMHVFADGSLLVAVAGTGDPSDANTGALLHLRDTNQDDDFDDAGERTTLLDKQPSNNILEIVRRDEVFGMAGIAEGKGTILAALAFFGGPSTIFRVDGERVAKWGSTHGNVNDLAYDPKRGEWVGVASTTDEVLRLLEGGRAERIVKIPPLASGQDPVPGYLTSDPMTGDLLVSLFSGSPEGEEGGEGVELVPRAASIVRVKPETRAIEPVVTALTVPTDLATADDGSIYVLEFCDAFLDPVGQRAQMQTGPSHGGFRRFSGRLLHVDRKGGKVTEVASGLDAPTNLVLAGKSLYVAEGMGTPGRSIPGPDGKPRPLTGFIERITLP